VVTILNIIVPVGRYLDIAFSETDMYCLLPVSIPFTDVLTQQSSSTVTCCFCEKYDIIKYFDGVESVIAQKQ
jgi:hypothetical protein